MGVKGLMLVVVVVAMHISG